MKKILFLILFLIVFKAVSDGLVLSHHHLLAGIFEFIYQAVLICGLIYFLTDNWKDFAWMLFAFVLLRFALFDIIHNLCAEQDWNFIGTTKLFDIIRQKFYDLSGFPLNFMFWPKLFALIGGISILINIKNDNDV